MVELSLFVVLTTAFEAPYHTENDKVFILSSGVRGY